MSTFATYDKLAKLLDVKPKTIASLVKKGMPQRGKNSYDVDKCFHWYVRFLHRALATRGVGEDESVAGINLRRERHRLIKAQADLEEMEVLERRRLLIPLQVYEQHLTNFVITTRQRLLALPARLSRLVAGLEPYHIREKIDREIRDILTIWSKGPSQGSVVSEPDETQPTEPKVC